jgi:long-chain acyl-CoA synthetase
LPAVVFLTGSTGFVGTQIARRLIGQTDSQIIVLVRAASQDEAVLRLKRAWWEWSELTQNIGSRVSVLCGDLTKPCLNLEAAQYKALTRQVTHIIHCAANTTPNLPINELREINVVGSAKIIELAKEINQDHGLCRLSHVSTAYVAGKRNGEICEADLSKDFDFSSLYEQTKYESELLMNDAKAELPITIFRPSLVVGDSKTGAVKTFNTIYYLLKQYLTGHLRFLPVSPNFRVNIVPVDYVADAIASLTFNAQAAGLTFHLTLPNEKAPTAKELVEFVRSWANKEMRLKLPKVVFLPSTAKTLEALLRLQSAAGLLRGKSKDAYRTLAPYFSQRQSFNRENAQKLLGDYVLGWREMLPHLLQYGVYYSFFHRSERTVHEQIIFRLESKNKPIRYHEIKGSKVVDYDTEKVRCEILKLACAIKAMGVGVRDFVAVLGNNCVRYLMIDVAVGLVGAVSCPIYVTSPVVEINKILNETKAKLLFVGAQSVLEGIDGVESEVPVVSFCPQPSTVQESRRIVSWERFLERASGISEFSMAPVGFADLATVRYTYGSTGEPKGACLEHGSLRYVAEALASNFPWKTRNSKASYLSFLPMNHVAEGVTATYSPYFIPAAMDFYYLENFHNLQEALKLARPSVLFAIPRFYEKLWTALASNSLGQQYIKTQNSIKKRLLRRFLRFVLLRKAGLDKSSQLIVGAACSNEKLLRDFHNLGVEVHNAYGLSEAPLVAMNRLGFNNSGSVGLPLSGTQVRVDVDGEILLKGPQVMRGYLNRDGVQPFRDGWFATGDIGELTPEGYLKILGRKKNLIVTSYGKKIPVERIELALKSISCVRECVVLGDNQPYCSAVIWVDKPEDCKSQIDLAIQRLNMELEHPARIRQFVLLKNDVSFGIGNSEALKVRRQELLKRVEDVVEQIYQSTERAE